jgi:hypothetical protein
MRFGFGERTGESEEGGLDQYEDGHVDVSQKAFKHAVERFPSEAPAGAVALRLAETAGVDLADHVESAGAAPDWEALHESVSEIDGVGEETADAVLETLQESL